MENQSFAKSLEEIGNQLSKLPPAFTVLFVTLLISLHFIAKIIKETKPDKPDGGNLGKHAMVVVLTIAICTIGCFTCLILLGKL